MAADAASRGARAGLLAALATTAAMYLAGLLTGMRTLPDLLQQPVLAAMPGPLFGFLIDTLQHAGKVVEEAGLMLFTAAALTVPGVAAGVLADRRGLPRAGLLAAAAGWLAVMLVVLPLAGLGLFGQAAGLETPVLWALVLFVYWPVWELARGRAPRPAPVDLERRRILTLGPRVIAIGSVTLIGLLRIPGWAQAIVAPPESGLTGTTPAITPVANFYRVSKNFVNPVVREAGWKLQVDGLVERTLDLAYRDLVRLAATTQIVTLECISNDVGGDLMSTGRFTGLALRDLLAMAGPRAGAAAVNFHASDRYTESLALSDAMGVPDVLVAVLLDGAPLPGEHGFPARVLIPGRYGMKGPKWLDRIEVAAAEGGGLWEQEGWNPAAAVRTTSRIDSPRDGAVLRRASVPLAGVAFAGAREIQAVEWSADAGRNWSPAVLAPALSPLTWVLWRAAWTPAANGVYTLMVRARDGTGALQTAATEPSYPAGASGYHRIQVAVGG